MNTNKIVLILSAFIFVSMFSFAGFAEPMWDSNTNTTPTNYNSSFLSEFNVTWTNDVNMTFISIINSTDGTVLVNNASMTNDTYEGDIYNFLTVLPAGSWNWTSYANNTTDGWNSTPILTIEIGKGEVPLILENNNSWSGIYLNPTNTTGSGCPTQINCTLYRNDTYIDNSTPVSDINDSFDIGSYVYIYNTSGNENYSSNSTSNTLVINKIPTTISLWLNDTEASKSYLPNQIANFTALINVSGFTINITSNYTGWNDTNNDTIFYNTTNLTEEGLFYINVSSDGNETYSSTSTTYYFDTIRPTYSLTSPNSSEYYLNKTYWLNITVFAATVDDVTLEFNDTIQAVNNSSNSYWFSFIDSPAINYTYRWNITNSLGNKTTTENISYNITKKYPIIIINFSSSTITEGGSVSFGCYKLDAPSSSILNLYRNSALVDTDIIYAYETTSSLSAGSYVYSCTVNESQNYTLGLATNRTLTVNSGTFTPGGGAGDDTTTTTTGQFTITPSESSLSIETGSSRVISFNLTNTYENDINVTSISIDGINSTWYALDKTMISRLNDGTSERVTMTLNIPSDAEADVYEITVTAVGKNLFTGATYTRETTVSLNVSSSTPQETVEAVLATEENTTANDTINGLTGLLPLNSEFIQYAIIALGVALSILIFFKRDVVTSKLFSIAGMKPFKDTKTKKGLRMTSLKDIKAYLKKRSDAKALELKEEKVADLENEIKKDMNELKNIMEAEKKMKKHRK